MIRGLIRRSASYPKPRRSIAPGPKFSTTTSPRSTIRSKRARPRSAFRSSVTLRLLALSKRKNHASVSGRSESARRPGSPPGGSILMTSAPSHPSICAQLGPASYCVRSSTTIPSSALAMRSLLGTSGAATGSPCSTNLPNVAAKPRRSSSSSRLPRRRLALLGRVGREADRRGARRVVGHDVHDRRLARRIGPLERGPNLVRLLDELTMSAEIHGDLVVAGVAKIATGLVVLRVRGPAAVVADDDEHRDPVAHRRVDLVPVDAVGAVAVKDDHLRVRARDLRADTERQSHAHAPEGAGVQPMARREGRDRLASEVEDLLAVHDEDRVTTQEIADLLAEPERMDRHLVVAHGLLRLEGLLRVEALQLVDPRAVASLVERASCLGRQLLQDSAGVAEDRHVRRAVVTELGRINVDLDDLQVRGEARRSAELDDVVEAGADVQNDVRRGR